MTNDNANFFKLWFCAPFSLFSVDQVFQFGVDQRKHDGAGAIQDGSALEQSSGFGAPRLGLEIEVDGVQCHSEEVSDQSHGFGVQPGKKEGKQKHVYVHYKLKSLNRLFVASQNRHSVILAQIQSWKHAGWNSWKCWSYVLASDGKIPVSWI